ncbi:hypothetical protein [Acidomonas methanolica]|uniref:hypothetical protein n=1 Tax=Acidomonas methanolica TaxID=437 RepID=UPI001C04D224|nr:hypothetical protein [Acidomonas methanolica]MBU2653815.1 hypothetical protein [Acidomonas methanolica]
MTALPVVPRLRAGQDAEEAVAPGFVQALQDAYDFIAAWPEAGSLRYAYELALSGLRTRG